MVPPEEDAHADLVDIDLTYVAKDVKLMFVFVLISLMVLVSILLSNLEP